MTKSASSVRDDFIQYFRERGHVIVPGSPVVPYDDPTLLFTNAGMNQFKPLFLGTADRHSDFGRMKRAANTQGCIRAGGKHNDLDDVGHDTYHHTFFEMLGNWSFGDYFKREAIERAWDLLTRVWGLDPRRLHATYFGGDPAEGLQPDEESRSLWAEIAGLPPERIHPGSKKDNFWEMGDTGPCGPCSEIHVDLTPDLTGGRLVNKGDARAIEIWNLVFIQFNRGADGRLASLPAKHVDTGMGFERIAAVLAGHNNNYGTDVFVPLLKAVEKLSGHSYGRGAAEAPFGRYAVFQPHDLQDVACRVIADHIRTLTFAISDGAPPDKEGRGYVLRRILRRAVRYGWQYLGLREPFLCKLTATVVDTMGAAFPRLKENPGRVAEILQDEETSFARTLERGLALFDEAAQRAESGRVRGDDAFKLHDTYGFPIDLTQIMAQEQKLTVDLADYERRMDEAREKARGAGRAGGSLAAALTADLFTGVAATDDSPKFNGEALDATICAIVAVEAGGATRRLARGDALKEGEAAGVAVDRTCFYGEQGGQVGDHGAIVAGDARFVVSTTTRLGDIVVHVGALERGSLAVGQTVRLEVDPARARIRGNHTATHVLNWALRETLGEHVMQKGSLVDDEKTRFDFSHPKALSDVEIARIESLCAAQIAANHRVYAEPRPQGEAMKINGLRAVFGEKYPDVVRVVSIGAPVNDLLAAPNDAKWRQFSVEFCGGTHVASTGEIGAFTLTDEEAVAKGVRRVVGVSGEAARRAREAAERLLTQVKSLASGVAGGASVAAIQQQLAETALPLAMKSRVREALAELSAAARQQQKAAAAESAGAALGRVDELIAAAAKFGPTTLVVADVGEESVDALKTVADAIKQKCGSAAVFLATRAEGGKCTLLAAVSDDAVKRGLKAGDWVKAVAPLVEGGGGGPPTMAQAGGKNAAKIGEALDAARVWAKAKLSGV